MNETQKTCACADSKADASQAPAPETSRCCPCQKNVGAVDRVIRILVALGAIGAGILFHATLGMLGMVGLIVVGGILLLTTVVGWCPLYTLLHLSTCGSQGSCKTKDV